MDTRTHVGTATHTHPHTHQIQQIGRLSLTLLPLIWDEQQWFLCVCACVWGMGERGGRHVDITSVISVCYSGFNTIRIHCGTVGLDSIKAINISHIWLERKRLSPQPPWVRVEFMNEWNPDPRQRRMMTGLGCWHAFTSIVIMNRNSHFLKQTLCLSASLCLYVCKSMSLVQHNAIRLTEKCI